MQAFWLIPFLGSWAKGGLGECFWGERAVKGPAQPRDSVRNPVKGWVGGDILANEERSDEYRFMGFAGGKAAAG